MLGYIFGAWLHSWLHTWLHHKTLGISKKKTLFNQDVTKCNQYFIKSKTSKKTSVKLIIERVGYTNLGYIEKTLATSRFFGVTNDLQLGYIDPKSNKIRKKHLKKFNRIQSNCNGGATI